MLLALALVAQVRGILASATPMLRAVSTLAGGVPMLLVLFAATYVTIAEQQPGAFSEPLNRTDGLYFAVTTFATVGYGDISPVTEVARIIVTVQMVVGLVTVGVIAKVVLGAVRVAPGAADRCPRRRRAVTSRPSVVAGGAPGLPPSVAAQDAEPDPDDAS